MYQLVEPRVRRLVAEHLGVSASDLSPGVSLVDDLAADSLDLVELSLALEDELGIAIPERIIDDVRTYGELVTSMVALAADGARQGERQPPTAIWARLLPSGNGNDIQRTDWLTPYTAETIAEDALRIGPGARLELTVPGTSDDSVLTRVRRQFAWLGKRGVQVSVRRDLQRAGPTGQYTRPHAAA
jgi:acyl carrier protein